MDDLAKTLEFVRDWDRLLELADKHGFTVASDLTGVPKKCEHCERIFRTKLYGKKYCSHSCQNRARVKRRKARLASAQS